MEETGKANYEDHVDLSHSQELPDTLYIPDGVGEVDVDDGEADDGMVIVGECCGAV